MTIISAPRHLSQEQFHAQEFYAKNARHALESEPRDSFTPVSSSMLAHGIPKSGTCKWQFEMKMADGSTYRFPATIHE